MTRAEKKIKTAAIVVGITLMCGQGIILGLVEDKIISPWVFFSIWPVVGLCLFVVWRKRR